MATARSTFVTRIQNQIGDTSGTYYTAAEIAQWVQDAHDDLARETKYYRVIVQAGIVEDQAQYQIYPVTVTATSQYLTPLEISEVLVMTSDTATAYTAMLPLRWYEYRQYMRSVETESAFGTSGTPTHYVLQGEYLYLYPTPNYDHADHGLRLHCAVSEYFTADDSTSHLPLTFEDAVVWYGAWRAHMKDDNPSIAMGYLGKYERVKAALGAWVASLRTGGPERIPHASERGRIP